MGGTQTSRICFLTACWLFCQFGLADEPSDQRLAGMRERAESVKISFIDENNAAAKVKLIAEPLIRYSDVPRGIVDGSFWCWESDGRPVAFEKIEFYDTEDTTMQWFYCFASASQQLIRATWSAGEQWTATAPGVKLQVLATEPVPEANKLRVSFQIKNISRRFSVRLVDELAGTQEQLPLIPRPVYQYGDVDSGTSMGAVFRFATGTNPDALLLIELAQEESGAKWKYGWMQMTTGKLTARLDDEVVWTAPYRIPNSLRPSKFESWLFFQERTNRR